VTAGALYAGNPIGPWGRESLRPGDLGLVVAGAGVGKTALLVHVALQWLLRGERVLHVALRDTVDHARAHYDEVLRAVQEHGRGDQARALAPDAAVQVERNRMILSFQGRPFELEAVHRNLAVLEDAAQFRPAVLLFDGLSAAPLAHVVPELRALAERRAVPVFAAVSVDDPTSFVTPDDLAPVVRLDTRGRRLALLVGDSATWLEPSTLLTTATPDRTVRSVPERRYEAQDCTLYSGGALGAESAFGEAAAARGVHEVNLTFAGHLQARTRGRYELSPKELALGDVSLAYVSKRLHRTYNDQSGLIRGVLQTLWHMVSRSQQVFVVGAIQADNTVVGGTGWGVELARTWSRELWVFDQEKQSWFTLEGGQWVAGVPVIRANHFCGTGTRYLEPSGRAAIDDLFARSFPRG
jgi:hypothetical protein